MTEPIIHNLFPTPVYATTIKRPFTKQELQFVKNQKSLFKKSRKH